MRIAEGGLCCGFLPFNPRPYGRADSVRYGTRRMMGVTIRLNAIGDFGHYAMFKGYLASAQYLFGLVAPFGLRAGLPNLGAGLFRRPQALDIRPFEGDPIAREENNRVFRDNPSKRPVIKVNC